MRIRLTTHAHERLVERNIDLGKVKRVVNTPSWQKRQDGGTILARKVFEDGSTLEVVYTRQKKDILIITFYHL